MEGKKKYVQKVKRGYRYVPWWERWLSLGNAAAIGMGITMFFAPITSFGDSATTNKNTELAPAVTSDENKIDEQAPENISDTIEEVAKSIVGVVNIQETSTPILKNNERESGTGSGIIFKKSGPKAYIVTNYHVIARATEIGISLHNGEKVIAKVVGTDPLTDLAVLEVPAKHVTSVAVFGNSQTLRAGEQVLAIGNPLGLKLSRTVTKGIISGTERTVPIVTEKGEWELTVLQTDAAINPGNSGGALINMSGEVIGINSLKISQNGVEGIGFALPSNDVIPIVQEIMENGKVSRPYIGIQLLDLAQLHPSYVHSLPKKMVDGVLVASIDPKMTVTNERLQVEDIIVAINDHQIKNRTEFQKYVYQHVKKGDEIKLTVYRNGKLLFTNIIVNQTRN